MSDTRAGEGWWLASDGKWYAPELHPDALATAVPPAPGWWMASDGNWYAPERRAHSVHAGVREVSSHAGVREVSPDNPVSDMVLSMQVTPYADPPVPTWFPARTTAVPDARVPESPGPAGPEAATMQAATMQAATMQAATMQAATRVDPLPPAPRVDAFPTVSASGPTAVTMSPVESGVADDAFAGQLVTGCALLLLYVALLGAVLAHNAVLGLTYGAPAVAVAFLVRQGWIHRRSLAATAASARSRRYLHAALGVRVLVLAVGIGAAILNYANGR